MSSPLCTELRHNNYANTCGLRLDVGVASSICSVGAARGYLMWFLMGVLVAQVNRGSPALRMVTVSIQTGIQACSRITPKIKTIY